MRRKNITLIVLATFFFICACSNDDKQESPIPEAEAPRIVAYLPTWKMPYTPDWKKITHLCIAFGLVQSDGSLDLTEVSKYRSIINIAHHNGVKVLLSIGGGGTSIFSSAILNINNRNLLINNLEKAIKDYDFDGIDVDYEEWEGGPEGYGASDIAKREALENMYRELRAKIGTDKLISAAVSADWNDGTWGYYKCYNSSMHGYLDFVNLMIYDETGPWEGARVGQHASWDFFTNAISYWLNEYQLPKNKLVAGVPFYGYRFQSENVTKGAESIPYKDILALYPQEGADLKDNIGLLYYNGIPTIKRKAEYILDTHLGGIMFWEISQDTHLKEQSLLHALNEVLK